MFDLSLSVKLIHIIAMSLMVGATVINGIIHGQAKIAAPIQAFALLKAVLLINRLIMAPSLLLIPLSGYWLMILTGHHLVEKWLYISAILSLFLIVAYLWGLRLERQLERIAALAAVQKISALPKQYDRTFLKAMPIGLGALVMSLAAVFLMIFKPF